MIIIKMPPLHLYTMEPQNNGTHYIINISVKQPPKSFKMAMNIVIQYVRQLCAIHLLPVYPTPIMWFGKGFQLDLHCSVVIECGLFEGNLYRTIFFFSERNEGVRCDLLRILRLEQNSQLPTDPKELAKYVCPIQHNTVDSI